MTQTWNDPSLPWQSPAMAWKDVNMSWNDPGLPWKANGWVEADAAIDLDFVNGRYYGGTLESLLSISRSSSGYVTDSAGLLTLLGNDVLRRSDAGLLVEPARTNLVLRSQEFDNASWTKVAGTSITANAAAAPDGTQTADRIVALNAGAGDRVLQIVTAATLTPYTGSIYLKGEGSDIGKNVDVTIKRANGTAVSTSVTVTLTGSWQRATPTMTTLADNTQVQLVIGSSLTNSAADVLVWGAQIEQGASATSYIPTTTAGVTRAADAATVQRTGIARFVFTFDDLSTQTVTGIDTGANYAVPTTLNRALIRRMTGYAS